MVDLIGDICIPSALVIPINNGPVTNQPTKMSGSMFISGAKLYFVIGTTPVLVTSA